jgi:F0F1-type ATP synthase membrane subunit a
MIQCVLAAADPLEDVLPYTYFKLGPLHLTNHMIMALVAGLLMLWIFPKLFAKPDAEPPTGAKNLFESILEYLRLEVFRPALKEHTDRFAPFLWSLFFFILFCNVLGCIPFPAIFELISGGHIEHLGGAATAGISTTAALAICAFFFIHAHGIDMIARALMDGTYGQHGHHQEHTSNGVPPHEAAHDLEHPRGEGLAADVSSDFRALGNPTAHYHDDEFPGGPLADHAGHGPAHKMSPLLAILAAIPIYLWNFAPHPFRPKEGESKLMWAVDIPMFSFLLVLELLGAGIKPFALCVRLFANMVAGHVLLAVIISLIVAVPVLATQVAIGIPAGLLDLGIQLLEVFVAFLQAYIFTFLTTLFLASAVAPEH